MSVSPMILPESPFGEDCCNSIAFSIAVSCRNPPPTKPLPARSISVPEDLSSLQLVRPGRRSPTRSPTRRSSHTHVKRITTTPSNDCEKRRCKPRPLGIRSSRLCSSALDLSSLDFDLAEDRELEGEEGAPTTPIHIALNDRDSVTAKGLAQISRALAGSDSMQMNKSPLVELQLAHARLGDDGVASVLASAQQGHLRNLKRLVLTGNNLSHLDGLASALAAGRLSSLRRLALSSNRLSAESLSELASATLANGSSALGEIEELLLDHNAIGANIDTEAATCSVGELTLDAATDDKKRTEPPSVAAILAILRASPRLRVLDLGSNQLTDTHLAAIAHAIKSGEAFLRADCTARIDISLNTFTRAGQLALHEACEEHGSIRLNY